MSYDLKAELRSKHVLVFGAAGGIGSSVARRLIADGYSVIIADIDAERVRTVAQDIRLATERGKRCDVTNESEVALCIEQAEVEFGPLYGMVCCAGGLRNDVHPAPHIVEVTTEEWDWTHNLNARGSFLCLREYLRARRSKPIAAGRAVLIASVAGQTGGRSGVAYSTAKACVISLVRNGAIESAGHGITVNAIAPGPIDTPALAVRGSEFRRQVENNIPVGRIGRPDEVAAAVSYLLAAEAGFVTGATLDINGGVLLR